jgi:protein TonB
MKPELAASFVAAALVHALLLFGIRLETPARPPAMNEETAPMDVSLVEAPPEPEPAAASPTPAEPAPTPEPLPTPDMSTPPPEATPEPEMTPEPETIPESTPAPPRPKPVIRREEQTHSKPKTPHSAAGSAATLAGAATGQVSSRPGYLSNPRPDYPEEAQRQHQEGVVLLNVEVGADGRASEVTVRQSSGFPLLDEAALEAVRRWRFEPARSGGLPVSSEAHVPVRFILSR